MFGERVWCLRQLARTLRERHGVEAHVADGSITTAEFETLKRRFTAGEFPVLCLSRIGHEGHNLQNASVLCHLDLPWLPSGLEQRVGRAARPGAARAHVQTYIPYIRRGGIEHVVSVLAARGAEHHQILDSFEGVHAAESTVATQLGQITGQVADSKDDAGYAATAARLRVAASVFGRLTAPRLTIGGHVSGLERLTMRLTERRMALGYPRRRLHLREAATLLASGDIAGEDYGRCERWPSASSHARARAPWAAASGAATGSGDSRTGDRAQAVPMGVKRSLAELNMS